MNTNTTKISNAAIILADVPYIAHHPHQHYGTHFYVVVSNPKACTYAPVVQAIPVSSNIHRRLPVQIEVHAECFDRRTFALAEQLTLLPREILERGRYCGQLGEESMARLRHAIKIQLALD
jgi:mRNA-degrading endonuclease toxin of MazEF toxin-antitoxin module